MRMGSGPESSNPSGRLATVLLPRLRVAVDPRRDVDAGAGEWPGGSRRRRGGCPPAGWEEAAGPVKSVQVRLWSCSRFLLQIDPHG